MDLGQNCLSKLKARLIWDNATGLSDCAYLNLNKRGSFHTCDQKRPGEYTRRYQSFSTGKSSCWPQSVSWSAGSCKILFCGPFWMTSLFSADILAIGCIPGIHLVTATSESKNSVPADDSTSS